MYINAQVGNTKAQYIQDDTRVVQRPIRRQYLCSQSPERISK